MGDDPRRRFAEAVAARDHGGQHAQQPNEEEQALDAVGPRHGLHPAEGLVEQDDDREDHHARPERYGAAGETGNDMPHRQELRE